MALRPGVWTLGAGPTTLWGPDADLNYEEKSRRQKRAKRAKTTSYQKATDLQGKTTKREAPRPDYHANAVVRVQRLGVKAVRRQLETGRGPLQDKHCRMPEQSDEGKVYYGEKPPKETNWRRQGFANDNDNADDQNYTTDQVIFFIFQARDTCAKVCQNASAMVTVENPKCSKGVLDVCDRQGEHDQYTNMCVRYERSCRGRMLSEKHDVKQGVCKETVSSSTKVDSTYIHICPNATTACRKDVRIGSNDTNTNSDECSKRNYDRERDCSCECDKRYRENGVEGGQACQYKHVACYVDPVWKKPRDAGGVSPIFPM